MKKFLSHHVRSLASFFNATGKLLNPYSRIAGTFKLESRFYAGRGTRAPIPGLSWTFRDSWHIWSLCVGRSPEVNLTSKVR